MSEITFGQMAVSVGCASVVVVLLIVGIVLLVDWLERAKIWLRKRKMKTYMVQYITSRSYRDGCISFSESSAETRYFRARNPQTAVKKLLDDNYFKVLIRDVCICKVEEIEPK